MMYYFLVTTEGGYFQAYSDTAVLEDKKWRLEEVDLKTESGTVKLDTAYIHEADVVLKGEVSNKSTYAPGSLIPKYPEEWRGLL